MAGGCFQFGSHASGDVAFGPDGKLYASAGEGASFTRSTTASTANPCARPGQRGRVAARRRTTAPPADPLGVDGSVFRMDPDNGFDPDARPPPTSGWWPTGQRNPWRLTFRPGHGSELLVRRRRRQQLARRSTGSPTSPGDAPGQPRLALLRGQPLGSAVAARLGRARTCRSARTCTPRGPAPSQAPYFSYQTRDGGPLDARRGLRQRDLVGVGRRVRASARAEQLPGGVQGRDVLLRLRRARASGRWARRRDGEPDPATIQNFVAGRRDAGRPAHRPGRRPLLRRLRPQRRVRCRRGTRPASTASSTPAATPSRPRAITANRSSGPAPLDVSFSGATLDRPRRRCPHLRLGLRRQRYLRGRDRGVRVAHLRRPGQRHRGRAGGEQRRALRHRLLDDLPRQRPAGPHHDLPVVVPAVAGGPAGPFSATATDAQDGVLGASAFDWALSIRHCPDVCHTHPLGQFPDQAAGTFRTPDHEYPSHLLLTLTLTDTRGSRSAAPSGSTPGVKLTSRPAVGLSLTAGGTAERRRSPSASSSGSPDRLGARGPAPPRGRPTGSGRGPSRAPSATSSSRRGRSRR